MPKSLQDVAEVHYGKSQNGVADKYGDFPIIGTGGFLGYARKPLFSGPAIVVGRKGTLNNPIYSPDDFWAVDTTYAVVPKENIHPKWLYFTLKNARLELLNEATGVPSLSRDRLFRVPVQDVEFLEQTRIAYVLDTIDEAIAQTESVIAKLKQVRAGMLHDLLSYGLDEHGKLRDPFAHPEEFKDSPLGRIPRAWDSGPLSQFVLSAEYGISTSLGDKGYPVLRMNNLSEGEAELSDLKYSAAPVPEGLWLRPGDVLFNRTNSWEHVGRTGIWRGQIERATFASYLVRLNPNPDRLISELLNLWLNWPVTQIAIRRFATPAVQQVNINPTNLRQVRAAFPISINEQTEIVERINRQDMTIRSARAEHIKLMHLKSGIQDDLLTGRVRVPETIMEGAENA